MEFQCSVCKNKSRGILVIAEEDICFECYKEIFKDSNPSNVSKYISYRIKSSNLDSNKSQVKIKELEDSLIQATKNFSECRKSLDINLKTQLKDLEDIKQIVEIYSKNIGIAIYKDRIKPILEHIEYKINKLKGN